MAFNLRNKLKDSLSFQSTKPKRLISDGYCEVEMCDKFDCDLQVVRPGSFQCSCEDDNMTEYNSELDTLKELVDKARRIIRAEYDKALDCKAAAEADGTSDYDYWEGYVTAMDLADSLLIQD